MPSNRNFMVSAAVACVVLGACSGPTEPVSELVPGLIAGFFDGDPQISLVLDGTVLTVNVSSYGNSCRTKGELRVTEASGSRLVTAAPFDWVLPAGSSCVDIQRTFNNSSTIELDGPGTWTVRVSGLHGNMLDAVVEERTVQVGA